MPRFVLSSTALAVLKHSAVTNLVFVAQAKEEISGGMVATKQVHVSKVPEMTARHRDTTTTEASESISESSSETEKSGVSNLISEETSGFLRAKETSKLKSTPATADPMADRDEWTSESPEFDVDAFHRKEHGTVVQKHMQVRVNPLSTQHQSFLKTISDTQHVNIKENVKVIEEDSSQVQANPLNGRKSVTTKTTVTTQSVAGAYTTRCKTTVQSTVTMPRPQDSWLWGSRPPSVEVIEKTKIVTVETKNEDGKDVKKKIAETTSDSSLRTGKGGLQISGAEGQLQY